mgnify:FL=1
MIPISFMNGQFCICCPRTMRRQLSKLKEIVKSWCLMYRLSQYHAQERSLNRLCVCGFRLETAIPLLLRQLKTSFISASNVSIVFPDDGATKRFGDMFTEYKTITCAKVRNGDQRNVVVKDGKSMLSPVLLKTFKVTMIIQLNYHLFTCLQTQGIRCE